MTAYIVVQAKITDMNKFIPYATAAAELVEKNGGQYLVRGGTVTHLEGDWDEETKVVISAWPDRESALQFWHSPQYRETAKLRAGTGEFKVVLVENA